MAFGPGRMRPFPHAFPSGRPSMRFRARRACPCAISPSSAPSTRV